MVSNIFYEKIILGLLITFIIVAVVLIWQTYKSTSKDFIATTDPIKVTVAHTNEELCKSGDFTTLLDEEIKFNQEISKDRFVQYLRIAFNNWLSGKYNSVPHPKTSYKCLHTGLLKGKQCPDDIFVESNYDDDLFKINLDYLKSKFIVLQTDPAVGGGESIVFMFKDKPDKIFYAWVYRYRGGNEVIKGFDLRALKEYDLEKNEAPNIMETQKIFINQLCSQEAGI